jgi:hypothetical protein
VLAVAIVLAYLFRPTLPPPRITGYTQITHDGWQKNSFGQNHTYGAHRRARLYIQENVHGRFVVAQVSEAGGDPEGDLGEFSREQSVSFEIPQPCISL